MFFLNLFLKLWPQWHLVWCGWHKPCGTRVWFQLVSVHTLPLLTLPYIIIKIHDEKNKMHSKRICLLKLVYNLQMVNIVFDNVSYFLLDALSLDHDGGVGPLVVFVCFFCLFWMNLLLNTQINYGRLIKCFKNWVTLLGLMLLDMISKQIKILKSIVFK